MKMKAYKIVKIMKSNSWYQYIIAWLVVEIQGNALYCLFNLISSK